MGVSSQARSGDPVPAEAKFAELRDLPLVTCPVYGQPLIITQNGEAKAVLQDVRSFEQAQETMALLKILALGNRQTKTEGCGPRNVR